VRIFLWFALVSALLAMTIFPAEARKKTPTHPKRTTEPQHDPAQIEAATRLQVFLDRANFSPGAINGHYGEFTLKALTLYRQSRGEQSPPPVKPDSAPDINGKTNIAPVSRRRRSDRGEVSLRCSFP
jgi:hypothetical protein